MTVLLFFQVRFIAKKIMVEYKNIKVLRQSVH